MPEPLRVGDILHGYVGGYFGRDHYDCCRIEAIGKDWIVARYISGADEELITTAASWDDGGVGLMNAAQVSRDKGRGGLACQCGDSDA